MQREETIDEETLLHACMAVGAASQLLSEKEHSLLSYSYKVSIRCAVQ